MTPAKEPIPQAAFEPLLNMQDQLSGVRESVALLQQRVSMGMENMTNALAGQSQQLSHLAHDVREVSRAQASAPALDDRVEVLEELAGNHAQRQNALEQNVALWRGIVIGFGAAATIVAALATYAIQSQFEQASTERARIDRDVQALRTRSP